MVVVPYEICHFVTRYVCFANDISQGETVCQGKCKMYNVKCKNGEKTGGEKCGKMYNACINTKMLVKIHKWGGGAIGFFCMLLYKITI